MDDMAADPYQSLIEAVAERVKRAEVFEDVRCEAGALRCQARDAESEAFYQLLIEPPGGPVAEQSAAGGGAGIWIGLPTTHRWLSESLQAAPLHTGHTPEARLRRERRATSQAVP